MTLFFPKRLVLTILFLIGIGGNAICISQENEQIKRLQRTIFIYNFAQQVSWPNALDITTFKIGVLGPDRTVIDLHAMAQKRKIGVLPVEIVRFQKIKDIDGVQLLYVNNDFNFDIGYILTKISNKGILLVTEDYAYNSSMINMVNVGDSFEYEVNRSNLEGAGFKVSSSLFQHAVSDAEKWKELYKASEATRLESEKEQLELLENKESEIADQRGEIYDLATEIDAKDETVSQQQEWIRKLWSKSEIQQKKYEDKISIERELNRNIQEQIDFIKNQEEQIKQTDSIIGAQKEVLESLNSEIEQSKATITRKNVELDMRRRMNWLLGVLVGISLMGGFLLYRGYRTKNRLTKQLRQQNAQMREQSIVLARKNKELEEFAYIASHDLKEPLITISSLIGLLVDDYNEKLDDSGRENLSYISSSAQRMTQLIDALLEYSRIGRRKEYTNVEVSKLVQTLQKDLQHRIQESGAVIHAEDLPMVRGSLVDLRLLFQNLITNAMKFTREHVPPQIEIVATQKGNPLSDANGHWEFSITDNGIGIPEIHKDRIFSIFQRLHASDRYEGTGIGLAHCKKIVESHGGEIWLESTEGEGSTFFFTIPFEN